MTTCSESDNRQFEKLAVMALLEYELETLRRISIHGLCDAALWHHGCVFGLLNASTMARFIEPQAKEFLAEIARAWAAYAQQHAKPIPDE